ncbi:hypothetical protein ACHAWF_001604 [Thalassiosira exigua]
MRESYNEQYWLYLAAGVDDLPSVAQLTIAGDNDWLAPLVALDGLSELPNRKGATTATEAAAARSSLILALARPAGPDGELEAVASVELRLQPPDAKIPFSQPWLDVLERCLMRLLPFARGKKSQNDVASKERDENTPLLRPYLCNLCVSPALRSLGIGRALRRIVESMSSERWGYDRIYLHVDPSNDAARRLCETEGCKDTMVIPAAQVYESFFSA